MRVLVTGAAGFLGAHVVETLLEGGDEVRAMIHSDRSVEHLRRRGVELVQADLLEESSLKEACRGVEGLVHCAARMGYWSRQNTIQRRINVEGCSSLYRAAHQCGMQHIVHVSSIAAVGASRSGEVLDEEAPWLSAGRKINYVLTKRQGEERALAAAKAGLPIVVVNPSLFFGPRLDGGPPSGLVTGISLGKLPWIPPGGISITDVVDVAAACVAGLRRGRPGERYLLAGHNLDWEQLYGEIAKEVDGTVPARKLSLGVVRRRAFTAGLLDLVGLSRPPWTPELFLSYGYYSWFRSDKAIRELGYEIRPLPEIIRREAGAR